LKKLILNIIKYLVFLGLGVSLLYFAFKGIDVSKLMGYFEHANYFWVILALIAGFIAYIIRAHRWNLLIEPLGYKPSLKNSYHALILGYTANFAFPRIGEITRCGTLNRTEKIPADMLIGTVVAERAFDLLSAIVVAFITVLLKIDFFGAFFSDNIFKPFYLKMSSTFNFSLLIWITVLVSFIVFFFLVYAFRQSILKITLVKKVKKLGKGVYSGVKSVFKLKRKKEFLLHTILLWGMYYLMTYLIFFSLPSTSHLNAIDAMFLLVVGTFGMILPVQGGIGAFHSIVSLALTLYAIPREEGLAYAVISHESQSIFVILLGSISFLILFIRSHKKTQVNV
jgi:uncharacterized protein (TIRG00374 family)